MTDYIYRWEDDFSADPATHPEYVAQGAHMVYNGSLDQLDLVFINTNPFDERLVLGNSFSPIGVIEVDYNIPNPGTAASVNFGIAGFGWQVIFGRVGSAGTNIMAFKEGELLYGDPNFADFHIAASNDLWGSHTMRLIGLPDKVIFQIDGINLLEMTVNRTASIDCQFIWLNYGGTYSDSYINRFKVSTDPSLPLAPTILEPTNGTTLQTRLGPIITQTQANGSRLYVDLVEWAGLITGLTNVTWDPNGLKTGPVNMTETVNQAIADNDFFFVYRGNGGNSYRLVINEDFVAANNVDPGDTIEFDVTGVAGAVDQERLINIDDDNHLIVEIDESSQFLPIPVVMPDYQNHIFLHNINADGNDSEIIQGPRSRLINGNPDDSIGPLFLKTTVTYPVLIDIDLGSVRNIRGLVWGGPDTPSSPVQVVSVDVYSNTVPFVGASLAQGTLEANNYGNPIYSVSAFQTTAVSQINNINLPPLNFNTRYLRLAINADNLAGSGAAAQFGREIWVKELLYQRFDTANNYGMFQLSQNGSAYVTYPASGIPLTNASLIKLDLVDLLKVDQSYFIRSRLQTDLSD